MKQILPEHAHALAQFINAAVRPEWGVAGIYDALGKAREMGEPGDLAIAAIAAALNPENRTPAVIAMQGPHWAHVALRHKSSANAVPPKSRTCSVCYLDEAQCRARWSWDHEFESVADAKRRLIARAELPPDEYLRRRMEGPTEIGGRPVVNVELPE